MTLKSLGWDKSLQESQKEKEGRSCQQIPNWELGKHPITRTALVMTIPCNQTKVLYQAIFRVIHYCDLLKDGYVVIPK